MNTDTQQGGCLVVCSWQPGATHHTFDMERFEKEVCIPLLDVFITPESFVRAALVVTRYEKPEKNDASAEVGSLMAVPGEGLPEHVITPTSNAVHRNLRSWVDKGRVFSLNVVSPNEDAAISQAVAFARNQGYGALIIPHGSTIPTDLKRLGLLSKKAHATGCPLRFFPSFRSVGHA